MSNARAFVSFEFFPPKTAEAGQLLAQTLNTLGALNPEFVSVTYGAGGSTRDSTLTLVKTLAPVVPTAAHLTCVGQTRDQVLREADSFYTAGVRHIVALRGDMPEGKPFAAHPQGFNNAAELVAALRQRFNDMTISVAAYPEKHPDSPDFAADTDNLKRKFDAGAHQAITQFFFDNQAYEQFLHRTQQAGITQTIIAGILPIMNYKTTASFAQKCGAHLPAHLQPLFDNPHDDATTRLMIGAITAAAQCAALRNLGVEHFHFYTLNRREMTLAVARILGMQADSTCFERLKSACAAYL
jgi:methylenetetrahydrofolate reductase (NADPH)